MRKIKVLSYLLFFIMIFSTKIYAEDNQNVAGDIVINNSLFTLDSRYPIQEEEKTWKKKITISLSDKTISGTYGDVTFTNGEAELFVNLDKQIIIKNLPLNITYSISYDYPNYN